MYWFRSGCANTQWQWYYNSRTLLWQCVYILQQSGASSLLIGLQRPQHSALCNYTVYNSTASCQRDILCLISKVYTNIYFSRNLCVENITISPTSKWNHMESASNPWGVHQIKSSKPLFANNAQESKMVPNAWAVCGDLTLPWHSKDVWELLLYWTCYNAFWLD